MNLTVITGNVAQDATIRTNIGNDSSISFSVAVNKKWRNQAGETQEQTTWFDCTIWRKPESTAIANYLKKGSFVCIKGEVSTRAYLSKSGEPASRLCIKVDDISFVNQSGPSVPVQSDTSVPAPNPSMESKDDSSKDLPF